MSTLTTADLQARVDLQAPAEREAPASLARHARAIEAIDAELEASDRSKKRQARAEHEQRLQAAAASEAARAERIHSRAVELTAEITELHPQLVEAERQYAEIKNKICDAAVLDKALRAEAMEKRADADEYGRHTGDLFSFGKKGGLLHEAIELPPRASCLWNIDYEQRQVRDSFIEAFGRTL